MSTITTTDVESVTERQALAELSKFFQLHAARTGRGDSSFMPMFSGRIDEAWHRLSDDRQAYAQFCTDNAGRQVTHVSTLGRGPIQWTSDYEARFGALPVIWFAATTGSINQAAYELYRSTGRIEASWNCGPGGGDGDGSLTEDTTA
ncbi:hypothetical protein [Streptomyces albireticuli]|uniref:Uncharacterized protein n=1 Tax=Streptomyces albireticuli TaxID=1940 RepID=A0A2A2D9J5_9ACTN|nr:hypothetical protein [Streptomyces albireticuli]MCD9145913.1 hypothetical protein [Streptomyces albireticuli]MCD9166083.1 hypothetical protein [Streptomyces albireticuli]MCD9196363.1 hypothetical protein [Streptomyces albireticuli]PAU47982.1 hypothetical protein CK936_15855 [Streptomyces albireticuli]